MATKTYEPRASALRAAKKAGLAVGQFEVVRVDEGEGRCHWEWKPTPASTPVDTAPAAHPVDTATSAPPATPQVSAAASPLGQPVPEVTAQPPPTPVAAPSPPTPRGLNVRPSKSTVEKPTKAVWTIADEMRASNPNATRKDVVE